jgi:hypothetical protein
MAIFSSFSSSATSWRRVPRWLRSLGRPRDLGSHCRDYVRFRLEQSPLEDDAEFTNDTINLARYALAHSSGNLEDKIDALMLLSGSIYEHLYRHTDVILLEEMISLGREALALCGTGHLQRQGVAEIWLPHSRSALRSAMTSTFWKKVLTSSARRWIFAIKEIHLAR